jgi:type II secretory pathway pseudopilin PulG
MAGELLSKAGVKPAKRRAKNKAPSQRGVTLIESIVAAALLIIVVTGVMPVFILGFQTTEQQGNVATRTTEYAQDKMESLFKLDFSDAATDTTVFPPSAAGGSGLGGIMSASSTLGAVPPTAAVASYVDYLDFNGNLLTSSAGAYYTRQWSISTDSTATLKTITVVVTSVQAAGEKGLAPSATLVCIKSSGL